MSPVSTDSVVGPDPESGSSHRSGPLAGLLNRQLTHYPDSARRYFYLGIVVLATIVMYYELYIMYAVATTIIAHYAMTFTFFVYISVVGGVCGAFASLIAGLADRWGRANLVVYGLLVVGLLVTFLLPNAPNKMTFLIGFAAVSFIEGIVLVATPALIRDFSPQLGRASAMGYWTMGPVLGSLVVTEVTSHTFTGSTTWQDEITWAGVTGLVVFLVALVGLRELAPRLRDQLMVSLRDRALIEAKAAGIDTDDALRGHWRQMLRLDVIGSAFAISIFLLIYFAAVGFFVVYFSTTFGYTAARANSVAVWYWLANAISLVVVGLVSDRLRVRKPFMVVGAIGSAVMVFLFGMHATEAVTSYYTFAWLCAGIGVFSGITYAPWMASFTETVEKHNPAATATGLAVWGWIIRLVVAGSSVLVTLVVTSATPLVDHGTTVQIAATQAAPALAVIDASPANQQLFAQLSKYPTQGQIPPALLEQAVKQVGVAGLQKVQAAQPALAILAQYGTQVTNAQSRNPGDWRTWWFICAAAQVLFLPFIFLMTGRWRPRKAKQDAAEHEKRVEQELAELSAV
jgi:MFS family permease